MHTATQAYTRCSVLLRGKRLILRKFWCQKNKKKKSPEIQENTNSHVWQHGTKMTYSDKLFLLLSFMKKKCKYKDEKFLVEKKKAKLVKHYYLSLKL